MQKSRREREVWAVLSHINVAPIYGFAEDEAKFGQFGAFISPVLWSCQCFTLSEAIPVVWRRGCGTVSRAAWQIPSICYKCCTCKRPSSLFLQSSERSWQWERTVAGVRYLHQHVPSIVHGDLKLVRFTPLLFPTRHLSSHESETSLLTTTGNRNSATLVSHAFFWKTAIVEWRQQPSTRELKDICPLSWWWPRKLDYRQPLPTFMPWGVLA